MMFGPNNHVLYNINWSSRLIFMSPETKSQVTHYCKNGLLRVISNEEEPHQYLSWGNRGDNHF